LNFPLDISGAIREGGGAFGKREKALEDQYFRQLQQKQLEGMNKSHGEEIEHHGEEIEHHENKIKRHKEAIQRHKEKMNEMDKKK
jgi:hypothetical protein